MSAVPDDIDDADWWKNGKSAPASGPARTADGPLRILFIGGPYSGRRIDVGKLSEGELIRLGDTGELIYYVQDKPGSHNYYFHKALTEYFATHRAAAEKMFAGKMTSKELHDG